MTTDTYYKDPEDDQVSASILKAGNGSNGFDKLTMVDPVAVNEQAGIYLGTITPDGPQLVGGLPDVEVAAEILAAYGSSAN